MTLTPRDVFANFSKAPLWVNARVLIAAFLVAPMCAAEFPDKPVRIVVPFNPGGESDTFTRILQGVIQQNGLLDQPLVIINVGGAGGTIGSRRVKDADPDGYTILNLHDGIISAKLTGQVDFGPEAFEPIAAVGQAASMVCVKDDSRWKDLRHLLESASSEPDTIRFGANLGALSHFGALELEQTTPGAAFRYVPTGGGAKRFGDLLGDHIDVTVFNAGEYVHFKDSRIRALAILHNERHAAFPDIPTAREQGVDVVRNSMQYFWAPKKTPVDRIAFFVKLLRDAVNTKEMQTKLDEMKMDPVFLTGPELRQTLRSRELVMRGVRVDSRIQLPDTPVLAIAVCVLLGGLMVFQHRRSSHESNTAGDAPGVISGIANVATPSDEGVSENSTDNRRRQAATLFLLLAFCVLFSLGSIPFWLLSGVFIVMLGAFLLERTWRTMILLIATAVVMGPGCYFLFTKVLTIDLP